MAVTNYTNSYIYVVDTAGSVLSSFRCPKDNPADIETWDPGSYVTVAIPTENLGIRLTSAGSIINSFNGPGTRLTGFAAGGGQGIIFGDPETHKVYCYGYGNINVNEPIGIDASWLTGEPPYNDILVLDAATNYIYLYGWSPYTTVTPASLSRIKALFQ